MMNRSWSMTIVAGLFLAVPLEACEGKSVAVSGPAEAEHVVKIVFSDFYKRDVQLLMDGKEIFRGKLDVADSSNGISQIITRKLKGVHQFRMVSGAVEFSTSINIDDGVKVIYVNPQRKPFIEASADQAILLD